MNAGVYDLQMEKWLGMRKKLQKIFRLTCEEEASWKEWVDAEEHVTKDGHDCVVVSVKQCYVFVFFAKNKEKCIKAVGKLSEPVAVAIVYKEDRVLRHVISVGVLKVEEHPKVVGQGDDLVHGDYVDDGHDDVVEKHGHSQIVRLSVLHYVRAQVLDKEDKVKDEPNGEKRRHVHR